MSPSLLRSRCAHAFRIHWQANALPEERFKATAAPLAQVIRLGRWFTGSAQNSKPSAQLLTLNPERMSLVGQETFDVSHMNRVRIPDSLFPVFGVGYTARIPFPPGTKGVFYYHQPPALPPIAGGIRFRICDSVSQFANGKDLDVAIGEPWNIPLINIVKASCYKETLAHLLKEGLIDHGLVADIENIAGEAKKNQKRGTTIYDIDQPFVVNLSASAIRLRLNTRSCLRIVRFRPFTIFRSNGRGPQFYPFSGRMKARFELHPQGSDAEHAELRLRFLENLTPITRTPPDGYPRRTTVVEPRPGELLIRGKFDIKPWALSFTLKSGYAKLVREFLAERALEKEKYGI